MEIEQNKMQSKLRTVLDYFWLATVVSSFLGSNILSIQLPAIGALYPFRGLLPLTAVLYLVWAVKKRHNPWKNASFLQRICYVMIGILPVYGAVSLLWAIDFGFSFARLFNLCYDLCFFFLMLELCADKKLFRKTIHVSAILLAVLMIMGVYEVFCGGIINSKYDSKLIFIFFDNAYHLPVVTFSNANDYLSMVIFTLCLVLLLWAWETNGKDHGWIPVLFLPVAYFLIRSADSRLILFGLIVVMMGLLVFVLCSKTNRLRIIAGTAILILFVNFGNHYYEIKPLVVNHLIGIVNSLRLTEEQKVPSSELKIEKPDHTNEFESAPLKDQFVDINQETGEAELSTTQSAGVRVHLLIHAFKCFTNSKTLGVGLGNTEQLAKNEVQHKTGGIWSIHCFVARMIGDFGLFFLIPLAIIAIELLRKGIKRMVQGIKEHNRQAASFWVLYLMALVMFPFASTASSDSQDIIAMWIFLAGVVLFLKLEQKTEINRELKTLDTLE